VKEDVSVMAVDDGPFVFGDEAAFLVGLVVRGKGYLEAMASTTVSVDRLATAWTPPTRWRASWRAANSAPSSRPSCWTG